MTRADLAQYGGRILAGGVLQMRSHNDTARSRYQYRVHDGTAERRTLPDRGGDDSPWEPIAPHDMAQMLAMRSPVALWLVSHA